MRDKTGRPFSKDIIDRDMSPERRLLRIPSGFITGTMLAGEFWQVTVTGDYTAGDEMVILVNATSRDITITLPACSTNPGAVYYIKKVDTSNHRVIIKTDGPEEKIDDEDEFDIAIPYTCITPLCDKSDWWII